MDEDEGISCCHVIKTVECILHTYTFRWEEHTKDYLFNKCTARKRKKKNPPPTLEHKYIWFKCQWEISLHTKLSDLTRALWKYYMILTGFWLRKHKVITNCELSLSTLMCVCIRLTCVSLFYVVRNKISTHFFSARSVDCLFLYARSA